MMKKALAVTAALLAATTMTGCEYNFSFTTAKLKAAEVQTKVAAEIKAQTGREALVSCPEDLTGKVGATMTCQASLNSKSYPVHVTVTEAKGSNIKYVWRLDGGDEPTPTPTRPASTRPAASSKPSTQPSSPRTTLPASDGVRVTKENLQAEVASVVKRETGQDAAVTCPRDLDAKPGTSTFCTVEIDGKKRSAKIEITRVEGRDVYFTTKVL